MIEIDGSYGEGGGQILRTALSLSCLFGKPFRIFSLRARRSRPGLMPQHLMAVHAAQRISCADVTGASVGSTEVQFSPRTREHGEFRFDIGTAGSTSLVLQTILPALLFSGQASTVTVIGGTHVPGSPSFHYLAEVFAPVLVQLGLRLGLRLAACGFYPKGGGRIMADISPATTLVPFNAVERGKVLAIEGLSAVGNLPDSIAERQKGAFVETVASRLHCPLRIRAGRVPTPGKGTFLFCKAGSEHALAGFTALGELGKKAETVGEEAGRDLLKYLSSDSALDSHLPDQIVLYLALCTARSRLTASCITSHLLTNLWAIGLFHDFSSTVQGEEGGPGTVTIN